MAKDTSDESSDFVNSSEESEFEEESELDDEDFTYTDEETSTSEDDSSTDEKENFTKYSSVKKNVVKRNDNIQKPISKTTPPESEKTKSGNQSDQNDDIPMEVDNDDVKTETDCSGPTKKSWGICLSDMDNCTGNLS